MGGGLKTLQRLAAVSSLSEFCRVADKKGLIDELTLVNEPSTIPHLLRLDYTTTLTAALVRGLELFVSSSVCSASATSTSTSANSSRATANSQQRQGGTTVQGGQCGSSPPPYGQHIPLLTAGVQDSYQHLRAVSMAVHQWYTIVEKHKEEQKRATAAMLTSGLLGIVPDVLYCAAAHAEQVRQQLEQHTHQQQRPTPALQMAARPLNEILVLSATLLQLQADCYNISERFQNDATTAEFKAIPSSSASLMGSSAAVTAIWRCDHVLQACLGGAAGEAKIGKYKCNASLHSTAAFGAAHCVMHFSRVVGASQAQPEKAAVADAVAAVSLDAMLGVVLANMAILASVKHQRHQGVSSALSLDGVNHIVPPSHEAILQAVGFPPLSG